MLNKFLILSCALASFILFPSCEKENDPKEESPFFSFLDETNVDIDTVPVSSQEWEYGFKFKVLKKGKVKRLGLKLPTTGKFAVKLWDLSGPNPTLMAEKEIDSDTDHQAFFENVPQITLEANKEFGLSIRANSFYRIQKRDSTAFQFPRKIGNISIESFNEEANPGTNEFPSQSNSFRVAPYVNVIFITE